MPRVDDEMPPEGMEVRIFGLFGEARGYWTYVLGVPTWFESIDGPDRLALDRVDSWLPRTNPLWKLKAA